MCCIQAGALSLGFNLNTLSQDTIHESSCRLIYINKTTRLEPTRAADPCHFREQPRRTSLKHVYECRRVDCAARLSAHRSVLGSAKSHNHHSHLQYTVYTFWWQADFFSQNVLDASSIYIRMECYNDR